jgi:hypothetical protein
MANDATGCYRKLGRGFLTGTAQRTLCHDQVPGFRDKNPIDQHPAMA